MPSKAPAPLASIRERVAADFRTKRALDRARAVACDQRVREVALRLERVVGRLEAAGRMGANRTNAATLV